MDAQTHSGNKKVTAQGQLCHLPAEWPCVVSLALQDQVALLLPLLCGVAKLSKEDEYGREAERQETGKLVPMPGEGEAKLTVVTYDPYSHPFLGLTPVKGNCSSIPSPTQAS